MGYSGNVIFHDPEYPFEVSLVQNIDCEVSVGNHAEIVKNTFIELTQRF